MKRETSREREELRSRRKAAEEQPGCKVVPAGAACNGQGAAGASVLNRTQEHVDAD